MAMRIKLPSIGNKVLKNKKLDGNATLKITQNEMSGRIFVEFSSEDGKLVVQKSFQGTVEGKKSADSFSKTIKSIKDLRKYFGIKEPKKVEITEVVQIALGEKDVIVKSLRRN